MQGNTDSIAATCPHGVQRQYHGIGGVSIPVEARCSQCATDLLHDEEREAILTYGAGWIDGYTGDEMPEVATALDAFLTDIREGQHRVI